MNKKIIISAFSLLIIIFFIAPVLISAEDETVPFDPNGTFGWSAISSKTLWISTQNASPVYVALQIVNTALVFLGVASSAMILYAGLLWFLARDNEEQVEKATQILKGAVIGLALIILSYGLAYAVWWMAQPTTRSSFL